MGCYSVWLGSNSTGGEQNRELRMDGAAPGFGRARGAGVRRRQVWRPPWLARLLATLLIAGSPDTAAPAARRTSSEEKLSGVETIHGEWRKSRSWRRRAAPTRMCAHPAGHQAHPGWRQAGRGLAHHVVANQTMNSRENKINSIFLRVLVKT